MTDPDEASQLADTVAARVLAVPGVAGLHGGMFGEVATYLPGRRLAGIRLTPGQVDVHLVMWWGNDVATVATAVRSAVGQLVPAAQVAVTVEDVAVADQQPPADAGD